MHPHGDRRSPPGPRGPGPRHGEETIACIGIGSNLGDRAGHVAFAFDRLATVPGSRLIARSGLIETAAVGADGRPGAPHPDYLNAAALVATRLDARGLLTALLAIEQARGRVRTPDRCGPRTLDLDLLLMGELVIDEPGLTVPHPRLHERAFALGPLAQIAPDAVIPTVGRTVWSQWRAVAASAAPRESYR